MNQARNQFVMSKWGLKLEGESINEMMHSLIIQSIAIYGTMIMALVILDCL